MKKKQFTEEQIINALKRQESGCKIADICRDMGIAAGTFYRWKSAYGGMEISESKRLKSLEAENTKLKRLLADAMLDNAALKDGCCLKKVVASGAKKQAVSHVINQFALSERCACQ
jgi:putative transposase